MKINSVFTLREFLSIALGHQLIRSRESDQYLVSYPRSGNTWMRTMLSVLVNPDSGGNPDFTRQNIPGVSISNAKRINSQNSPRLIKSHTWFRKDLPRAVYVVRDGRDVLISLYHYYITREKKNLSFSAFYTDYFKGKYGQLWHENVESWLLDGKELLGENLHIITFEELKTDTYQVLVQAAEFLDLQFGSSDVEKALEVSNIDRMRKIEKERRGPIIDNNASFYRGGKTGEWISYFDTTIEKKFMASAGNALRLAGFL